MGSAALQGELWGAQARDWAAYQEQTALPLFGAVLDAARVAHGGRLLDAGCGTGLAALLAALRGAEVSAIDASAARVAIVRERLPGADVREADLEALPFDDAYFDAAIAVNSVFYAAELAGAMRELARVVRPSGRVIVTSWGPAERCDYSAVIGALRLLLPPPSPGAVGDGPFALAMPGALEVELARAGLRAIDRGEVACPFIYPHAEAAWRGQASSGVIQRAIATSGAAAVRAAIEGVNHTYTRPDGSVRYENVFVWAAGERE